jgi:hypothetical protein
VTNPLLHEPPYQGAIMSVKKEPSGLRSVQVEVGVPGRLRLYLAELQGQPGSAVA